MRFEMVNLHPARDAAVRRGWHALVRIASMLLAWLLAWLLAVAAMPAQAQVRDYVVGAGDVLRVNVFQNADLTLETRVSDSGVMSYPLLGQVKVGGLTVPQVEAAIVNGLREGNFLKLPQVTVNVVQVRAHQVSVLGLVNRPGRYPIDTVGLRLSELLAQAGGVAAGGADLVSLIGERDGKPYRAEVDLPALYGRKPQGDDPVLRNGDVVFVDRAPVIYIYGEVQRPGAMRLDRDMRVMQALAAGGGPTLRGTEKGLRVHRRGNDGRTEVLQPTMDEPLRDGDVIYVRESLF
jgi:polysaccharide biosynthesis/export protein